MFLLVTGLTVCGAGIFIVPGVLRAGDSAGPALDLAPSDPQRAAVHGMLREVFQDVHCVLNVTQGEASPFTDVLIWERDGIDPDAVNPSELLLITHSSFLETLTAFAMRERDPEASEDELTPLERFDAPIAFSDLRDDGFAAKWKQMEAIESRVIATGVRSVRIEQERTGKGLARFAMWLRWASGTSDDSEEESAFEAQLRTCLQAP